MASLPRTALTLAVLAAAALPAAAAADAPWSPPAALPGAAAISSAAPGAMTLDGHAGAVAANGMGATSPSQLLRLQADGAPIASDGLGLADAHVAAAGRDGLVIAGSSLGTRTGTIDDTSHIRVAETTGAGGRVTTTPIHGSTGLGVDAVAANAAGDVVLVAFNTKERVVYLRRHDWREFHAKLTIKVTSQARGATVALGAKGDVLVVYEDRHIVSARHRGTTSWGSVHRLGAGVQSDLTAAVAASGRMLAAWKSQRISEGDSNAPAVVSFITAAPGHGWGSRRQIESVALTGTGHYVAAPAVELDLTGARDALLTWTGADATNFRVKAMAIADGHTSALQTLSPAGTDAILGDATTTPTGGGAALVLWRAGVRGADPSTPDTKPRLFASTRAPGATAFGAPEAISDPQDDVAQPPTALLDGASRDALAIFARVPGAPQLSVRQPIAP